MVDVRFLFKQMPRNRSLTSPWLVEIKTDRALMTGTPQHSLHATVPRSAVWRVACKLNPCTQALQMGDERFLSNVFKRFYYVFTFLNVFYIFLWTLFTSMLVTMRFGHQGCSGRLKMQDMEMTDQNWWIDGKCKARTFHTNFRNHENADLNYGPSAHENEGVKM